MFLELRTTLKIYRKYKVEGLHIAQFVQNGILNRYMGILIDELVSIEDFKEDITTILKNIKKYVLFVRAFDIPREIIKKSTIIVNSHSPNIFILSGIESAAKIVKDCSEKLEMLLIDYELEKVSGGKKEILFFKRILKRE